MQKNHLFKQVYNMVKAQFGIMSSALCKLQFKDFRNVEDS